MFVQTKRESWGLLSESKVYTKHKHYSLPIISDVLSIMFVNLYLKSKNEIHQMYPYE